MRRVRKYTGNSCLRLGAKARHSHGRHVLTKTRTDKIRQQRTHTNITNKADWSSQTRPSRAHRNFCIETACQRARHNPDSSDDEGNENKTRHRDEKTNDAAEQTRAANSIFDCFLSGSSLQSIVQRSLVVLLDGELLDLLQTWKTMRERWR